MGSKPKATTTYYAKPLHQPMQKKPPGPPKPKPEIFKVIIEDQQVQPQPRMPKQEQIFKIIHLPANKNLNSASAGKSVKILKIFHIKQSKSGQNRGWSK